MVELVLFGFRDGSFSVNRFIEPADFSRMVIVIQKTCDVFISVEIKTK